MGLLERISSDLDLPVVDTKINSRVDYTEASDVGKGVLEYEDPKAKRETINLNIKMIAQTD